MSGVTKALKAALVPIFGTENCPCLSRLVVSRWVPGVRLGTVDDTKSGRVRPGFSKCVYLNVRNWFALAIHEPSTVPIFCHDSLPLPAVGAVAEPNCEPVSRRCESR